MVHIAFDLDEGALASVRQDPATFTQELRIAAAAKWYELGRVSQGRAAEIAGLSRAAFIEALGRYGVSPFQESLEGPVEIYTDERVAELDAGEAELGAFLGAGVPANTRR